MKICMIVPDFDRIGGYEKQAFTLTKSLKDKGIKAFILTNKLDRNLISYEKRKGLDIYRIWPFLGYTRFCRFTIFYTLLRFLLLNYREYEIIHCHALTHLSVMGMLIGKMMGKKTLIKIATEGDITKLTKSRQLKHKLLIKLFTRADRLISLSDNISKELLSLNVPLNKIYNSFNGVDTNIFSPLDASQKQHKKNNLSLPNKKLVIFVGRFEYRKGIDVLLNAWKMVLLKLPTVHLMIIGFGQEMQSLKELTGKNKINSSVSFLGKINDVAAYLQVSDLCVIPSRREGNPNVLLEALSCGLPVIATTIGGIKEIVEDGENGLLITPDNAEVLSEKISFALNNEKHSTQMGKRARETAENNFSIDKIAERYLKLYENIVKI